MTFTLILILVSSLPGSGHGLLDEQIAQVTKELASEPGKPDLLLKRAYLYLEHDEPEKVRADLAAILRGDPSHAEVHLVLAILRSRGEQRAEALFSVRRYFELGGKQPRAYRLRARLADQLDLVEEAADYWQAALRVVPDPSAADGAAAIRAQVRAERFTQAEKLMQQFLKKYPRSIPVHQAHATLAIAQKDLPRTEQIFTDLSKFFPPLLARLSWEEGLIWEEEGFDEKARMAWQRGYDALKKWPASRRQGKNYRSLKEQLEKKLRL